MVVSPTTATSVTADALYHTVVWPALWAVLHQPSPATTSTSTDTAHERSRHKLQAVTTHALVQLLRSAIGGTLASPGRTFTAASLQGVASQLLLHAHGAASSSAFATTSTTTTTTTTTTSSVSATVTVPAAQRGVLESPSTPSQTSAATAAAAPTPATIAAAVEVERLFVLISTALHLAAQSDIAPLLAPAMDGSSGTAAVDADAASLPWGVGKASKAVVAGIFGIAACVVALPSASASSTTIGNAASSSSLVARQASALQAVLPSVLGPASPPTNSNVGVLASPSTPPSPGSAQRQQTQLQQQQHQATAACVQQLWLTFLFLYLQQMSAHTPKDVGPYTRFLAGCAEESRQRRTVAPVLPDSARTAAVTKVSVGSVVTPSRETALENEAAACRAWGLVSADLLRDTVGRTRFRRAALLYKSFVPHMPTQAPSVTFLLSNLWLEFSRSWGALMHRIRCGSLDDDVAQRLTCYDALGIVYGDSPARPSSQWRDCVALIEAYGDRLVTLLRAGVPHSQLVATSLLTTLSSLYVLPHTRTGAPPASGTPVGKQSTPPSPSSAKGTSAVVAAAAARGGGSSGRRDEEASVLEVETALRLPHRAIMRGTASTAASAADDAVSVTEAEWRLRLYAPFGQLLAYARLLELQKVPLFSVATTHMRVGRSAAQQVEHARLLALTACFCGVAGWDITLLLYHFADCPLNAFAGPDSAPPALPSSALARYTAAVRQYVEHTTVELIVDMPFTETRVRDGKGGGGGNWSRSRHGGRSGHEPSTSSNAASLPVLPTPVTTTIPSRGELHTTRFTRMVHPDPLLLNWRLQLTATEALVATEATSPPPAPGSGAVSSPTSTTGSAGGGGGGGGGGGAATSMSAPAAAAAAASGCGSGSGADASSDMLLSPCCLVRDLLMAGHFQLAVEALHHLAHPPPRPPCLSDITPAALSIDVLLLPRRAFPQGISVTYYVAVLLRRWLQRWDAAAERLLLDMAQQPQQQQQLRDEVYHVLHALSPLLSVVQSYLANQSLLVRLLGRLAWLCRAAAAADVGAPATPTPHHVFALTEHLLVALVMPCVRVLPPAPAVYDAMQDVLHLFIDLGSPKGSNISSVNNSTARVLLYGDNAAMPLHALAWLHALLPVPSMVSVYQTAQEQLVQSTDDATRPMALVHPHDALLRKEREALLSQSLKRLNADNLDEYRALLRPILYAEPLLVAHRLFTQAVGYNNSFLALHVALLRGLPAAVLTLMVQQGLLLMARYAAEVKITDAGGESRVAILATLLATLWRDNTNTMNGTVLVRRAELALRGDSGADIILGTELCKALLAVMAHRTLEYEEKYNETQLQALAYAPSLTSLFGRGAMTSFRMRLWKDTAGSALLLLLPTDTLVRGRQALLAALQKPCHVPLRGEEESDNDKAEEDKGTVSASAAPSDLCFTLGQQIVVHLCRLQSRIYALQRDADGSAELIMLSSAGRFNAINDMIVAVAELSPAPASASVLERVCAAVRHVGVPAVASLVEMQLRRQLAHAATAAAAAAAGASDTAADAVYHVPVPLEENRAEAVASGCRPAVSAASYLKHFTAAHFAFVTAPYAVARLEWQECLQRAQSAMQRSMQPAHSLGPVSRRRSVALTTWLQALEKRVDAEEEMHRRLLETSAAARAHLLTLLQRDLLPSETAAAAAAGSAMEADERLLDLAVSHLLPRALLNLREAATVAAFFTWLFEEATREAQASSPVLLRRATDLALTFVTAVFAHFVAFTDAECKRLGYVLQRLLQIPALSAYQQQHDAVAQLSPTLAAHVEALLTRGKGVAKAGGGAAGDSGTRHSVNGARDGAVAAGASSRETRDTQDRAAALGAATLTAAIVTAPPVSLLRLAAGQGLLASSSSSSSLLRSTKASQDTAPAAAVASAAASEDAVSAVVGTRSAIPWQLEAYMTRAMLQLLTHEDDVPAYALRNLFVVLEQVNKTTFPASLCAVDLLVRAVEPHALDKNSYFASALAVLKLLRANRRQRREVQQCITILRHGEDLSAHPAATVSAVHAAASATAQQQQQQQQQQQKTRVAAAAAACHGQWRLDEHYMRQLLREEVALLVEGAQAGPHDVDDDDDLEKDEEEPSEADTSGKERDDGVDGEAAAAADAAASRSDNSEVEEDGSSVQSGRSDDEESGSRSRSESDDEDRGDAEEEEGGSDLAGADAQEEEDDGEDVDDSVEDGDAPPAARKRRLED